MKHPTAKHLLRKISFFSAQLTNKPSLNEAGKKGFAVYILCSEYLFKV